MPKPTPLLVKADFVTGILLFLLGIYMLAEGLRMPGAGGYIEAGGEPGRVPVMLGVIISLLALALVIRSIHGGGHRLLQDRDPELTGGGSVVRGLLTAIWCSCYALAMLGFRSSGWHLSYQTATALFLLVFIAGFEWQDAREFGVRRWRWLEQGFPKLARRLQPVSRVLSTAVACYLWLISTAALQAVLVTWAISWLFETRFYVQLP